jgi:hypothetical protein
MPFNLSMRNAMRSSVVVVLDPAVPIRARVDSVRERSGLSLTY